MKLSGGQRQRIAIARFSGVASRGLVMVFKYYNNNYRPIYHLENIIFSIIKIIHNIKDE